MYRHRLRRLQLTLTVVCTGERWLSFFCDQMCCSHKYVGLNKIVYRAYETMHLISVFISVFRDVHNVNFQLVTNEKGNYVMQR